MLTRIYNYEEQRERASKALRLNGGSDCDYRLLAPSSTKPTIKWKRLALGGPNSIKLKGASSFQNQLLLRQRQLQEERDKAEKALRLNGISVR